jgi:hypothetical protein
MRRSLIVAVLCSVCLSATASAYVLPVTDVANWLRNQAIRVQTELHAVLQDEQRRLIRKMSRRITEYIGDVRARYGIHDPDPPRWRTHDFESDAYLWGRDYLAALNYGDASGNAFVGIARPLLERELIPSDVSGEARDALTRAYATLDLADAIAIDDTHQAGLVRYNGRSISNATNLFDLDALDEGTTESTTAVLDKLGASAVLELKQKQTRNDLLVAAVELALLENLRRRNTEAVVMNDRLSTNAYYRQYSGSFFTAAAAEAAATWRQP